MNDSLRIKFPHYYFDDCMMTTQLTNQEIQEILGLARQAVRNAHYEEAEELATKVLNTDLSTLNSNQQILHLSSAYRIKADSYLKRGMVQPAMRNAEESLLLSIESKDDESTANSLIILGMVCMESTKFSQAVSCFKDALEIYRRLNLGSGIANCNLNLGVAYSNNSQHTLALEYFYTALEEAKNLNLQKNIAFILAHIGSIYHVQSDYLNALGNYHQALTIHEELENMREAGNVMGNIGSAYRDLSDFHSAIKYYEKAVFIFEKFGLTSSKAITLGNIGITYRNLLNFPMAIEYLEKAVALHAELGLQSGIAMFLGNIGITYSQMQDYPRAIEYLINAYQLNLDIQLNVDAAIFASNLGKAYYEISNYYSALEYLKKALPVLQNIGRKEESAGTKGVIGLVYANPHYSGFDPAKAEILLLETIAEYEALGTKLYLYQTHLHLANFYKQDQRWEEYSEHIEKYHKLYIEVQNEEVKKQADRFGWERKIADMEKQKEIEAIKTDADKRFLEETISFQKQSLEQQAREVKNTVDELVRKNSLLQLIQSDLKKIAPHTKREGTDYIDQLLERVTRNITPLESNQQLDKQLTEVHGEFISNLRQKFPDLTAMELKIAALLTMKLTSSNIAAALFLAKRTVESHRFSLRKKMGLGTNDDIYQALAQYAT